MSSVVNSRQSLPLMPDAPQDVSAVRSRARSLAGGDTRVDPAPSEARTRVGILLCTYQGSEHLASQLDSFARQTHTDWQVWASDDGSVDGTLAILENYGRQWRPGQLTILAGPRAGATKNFLQLTCLDALDARVDYLAYSDQDDVWESHKLERALAALREVPAGVPALYCSRTRLVDEHDTDLGLSPLFRKGPSFANALVQSIGGGNTMVLNAAALALIRSAGPCVSAAYHDWWAYLVVTGCGGRVIYDTEPSLRYRQHSANLLGTNVTWRSKWTRIRGLWEGRFRRWNDDNIAALRTMSDRLTPENRALVEQFASAREKPLVPRVAALYRCGIHRQTLLGNLGLLAAAVLKKI